MLDAGVVLIDRSLRVLGCDRGAAAILNVNPKGVRHEPTSWFPKEFLDKFRSNNPMDLPSAITRFRIGASEYTCRASLLETNEDFSTLPMIALHLENAPAASDSLDAFAAKYHLTGRERDVLLGISKGLRTKELAMSLNISPNTVKAFLRLVMIKMAAPSRSALLSKIFQNAMAVERQGVRTEAQAAKRLAS
jgi:DNA-binding CsgD family transcriptional regulator